MDEGIQVASGCDANIYINTTAGFTNSPSASNLSFGVETVTVSDIAASCTGKSFKINLFDSSTSASLNAAPIIISYAASPTNGQIFNGSTWSAGAADIKVSGATLVRATIDTSGPGLDSRTGRTTLSLVGITTSAAQAIGAGQANTAEILAKSTGPGGARSAATYSNNGYSDWFLGSGREMVALCMYARGIITTKNPSTENCNTGTLSGSWSNEYITSSTRGYDSYMWRIVFTGYGIDFNHPAGAVRPIRMFAPGS